MATKEVENIKVMRKNGGRFVWLAPHLANDDRFLEQNGLVRVQQPEKFEPTASANASVVEVPANDDAEQLSKDLNPWTKAKKAIEALETEEEITAFIIGETRESVLKAAQTQIEKLA